ncbi:glutamate--cysteine ligase [Sciscionella marina]|uniref:glutamate--cysteine ligase n=1 Tax=Sciscionella marina TaxID=508770 RepID=UPI00039F5CAA|nr:glutamate--cysteine ligase [Sciscionella marina]
MAQVSESLAVSSPRAAYRRKVHDCLAALAELLTERKFDFANRQMGVELELNLVDEAMSPAMTNTVVLEKIDDPAFTSELGQHNLEVHIGPRRLSGEQFLALESEFGEALETVNTKARDAGAELLMIGTLPTITTEHFDRKWLSPGCRYAALNDHILAERGESLTLDMEGVALPGRESETLLGTAASITPESACTSTQLHLQLAPDDFAPYWNAAQCLAGPQVALAANSPFLLGKALWQETRIPLFQQATDTRSEELRNQGVRPRVWFGDGWISSIFDLFEENARYFPGLLPFMGDEEPHEALAAGRIPQLAELRSHNGTIWRWNRPVYDIVDGVPHLRLENRVLPAGPTVLDMVANIALFFGAQYALATAERPLWTQMSFRAAEENFYSAAKHGMNAELYWPGAGKLSADELTLRLLLPLAHKGLSDAGLPGSLCDRYLSVIEQRCVRRMTGSTWQRETVGLYEERGADRPTALCEMSRQYAELSANGEPVHLWPIE